MRDSAASDAAPFPIEALLRRDTLIIAACLAVATGLAWFYLVHLTLGMDMDSHGMAMSEGDAMSAMALRAWSAMDGALMFVMWAVMMAGMMLPGAAPTVLMFAKVARGPAGGGTPRLSTGLFASGYLLAWTGFSMGATALQWGLQQAALLSPAMVSTSTVLGGALLIAAGLYQWTPLKNACLRHCRSPMAFLMQHWRPGPAGALRMGFGHGAFCLGCCWAVMGLLFVGGVMNLGLVAAITAFVAAEKLLPKGQWIARLGGGAMTGAGIYLCVAG